MARRGQRRQHPAAAAAALLLVLVLGLSAVGPVSGGRVWAIRGGGGEGMGLGGMWGLVDDELMGRCVQRVEWSVVCLTD